MAALAEAASAPSYPARISLVASDRPEAPALARARALGLETWSRDFARLGRAAFEEALAAALMEAGAEAIALAGFLRVLSPAFCAGPWRGRILNIHPSLLPAFPGLDAPARALAAGAGETGASVHLVTAELDAGPVLAQAKVPVEPGDDPARLHARIQEAEHRLYPQALAAFLAPRPAPRLARGGDGGPAGAPCAQA